MLSSLLMLSCAVAYAQAHGRLTQPLGRASLWRGEYAGIAPANYDDDGLNCGGFYQQYSVNGGKCGICGDAYNLAQPRPHELGGKYGLGYIVANYEAGQVITVGVLLSASHQGYWELRICPEPSYQDQDCFDNGYILELEEGGTKFYPGNSGNYEMNFRLPADLVCEHCVLQWMYTAGNNWGVCNNGTQGLGCGNQEQFYSCADISIGGRSISNDIDDEDEPDSPTVTQAPERLSSPLIDCLTNGPLQINPDALQLLLKIEWSGYRVFCGNTPVTSHAPARKKYNNKHRRKKHTASTRKRKNKRHKKIIYWR